MSLQVRYYFVLDHDYLARPPPAGPRKDCDAWSVIPWEWLTGPKYRNLQVAASWAPVSQHELGETGGRDWPGFALLK